MSVDFCMEGATYHTYVRFCCQSQVPITHITCVRCIWGAVQSHMIINQKGLRMSDRWCHTLSAVNNRSLRFSMIIYPLRNSRQESLTTVCNIVLEHRPIFITLMSFPTNFSTLLSTTDKRTAVEITAGAAGLLYNPSVQ